MRSFITSRYSQTIQRGDWCRIVSLRLLVQRGNEMQRSLTRCMRGIPNRYGGEKWFRWRRRQPLSDRLCKLFSCENMEQGCLDCMWYVGHFGSHRQVEGVRVWDCGNLRYDSRHQVRQWQDDPATGLSSGFAAHWWVL